MNIEILLISPIISIHYKIIVATDIIHVNKRVYKKESVQQRFRDNTQTFSRIFARAAFHHIEEITFIQFMITIT